MARLPPRKSEVSIWVSGTRQHRACELFRINPQLPPIGRVGANTPLKAGTRVNLSSKALKASRPDVAKRGEGGLS
eukprot:COSAG02_NODE_62_length_43372_cov_14.404710_31_plen_75_part_00